ncbi:MAG: TonB-dependent receptor domain-containing protein [Pyrinomonadaceae bacterium]
MSKFLVFCCASVLVLAFCAAALAQGTVTGAIGGSVNDPKNAAVPGATVTVKNNDTGKEETITSDAEGRFKISNLQPGNYTVTVTAGQFAPYSADKVVVEVGRETTLDVNVGLQGSTNTVQVTAEAPVINTTQQDFSSNINQTTINESPINGRRWSNFAILTPGAVPDGTFGLISFRGISGLLNNNTVDGGDNNQAFFAEERGRTRIPYVISQASIREFQVNTSSYSAEYGRSAGGVTNAVTKSGTNELHGSAFLYDRNNKWGARNPLATNSVLVNGVFTPVGIKPVDVRYQFGGTVGGPIVKDKAFFFFSYDQQRRNFPGLARFIDPNVLNTANRTVLLAKGLTTPQIDSSLAFLNSLSGTLPRRGNNLIFLPKVDWHLNSKNIFTATYNWLKWDSPAGIQTQATNTRARDNFGDDFVRAKFLNLRLASTISSGLVNELRGQWGRDWEYEFSQAPLPGEPTTAPSYAGVTSAGSRSPQTFINNTFTFGVPEFLERPSFPDERRLQFADTMTWTSGNHTVKFGADINHVKDVINNLRFSAGEFNYTGANGLNDFIVDYTNFKNPGLLAPTLECPGSPATPVSSKRFVGKCYGGNFNQGLGVLGLTFSTNDYNFFAQDDWRVSPRLTLNLGLRYEYQQNPSNTTARINPLLPQTGNRVSDKNNWGPRFGVAYDVNGDGKTSIRGGYGIYFGRVINSTVYQALIGTGVGADVAQRQVTLQAISAGAPIYPNVLAAGALVPTAVQYFAPGFQLPRIQQLDAVFEREIAHNTVVSASYLFSYGESLPNFVDTNLPVLGGTNTGFVNVNVVGGPANGQVLRQPIFLGATQPTAFTTSRPNPAFAQITEIRSNVFSKYNALVLQLNRRMTNGLQLQSSYTLSRSYDNGQTSQTFTTNNAPFNAFDQSGEGALSAFDRRHKFVASLVYTTQYKNKDNKAARALLNGWTIAPIFNWFSGQRYTGNVSGNISGGSFGFTSCTSGGVTASCFTPGAGVNGSGGSNRFALFPRNFFKQPSIQYLDLRLSRRFNLGEKAKLELLGEAFNVFNRTQVTSVNTTLYSLSGTTMTFNPSFGQTTGADSTLFRERQIQLAVRFEF